MFFLNFNKLFVVILKGNDVCNSDVTVFLQIVAFVRIEINCLISSFIK